MNKTELIDKIHQLLLRSQALLEWCIDYVNLFNELIPNEMISKQEYRTKDAIKLLVFNHNLYFSDAVLCLNTVLERFHENDYRKELSIFEYANMLEPEDKDKLIQKLAVIKKTFYDYNLNTMRKKIFAHKDMYTSGDSINFFINFFKMEYLLKASEICKQLLELINKFSDLPCNNDFKDLYQNSHQFFLDTVRNSCLIRK